MKSILLVDDDSDIQKLLTAYLKAQYQVHTVSNGEEALRYLDTLSVKPDLIILDIEMPVMNGKETKAKLEKNPELAPIPVLFLTSKNEYIDGLELKTGFEFLNKPVSKTDLLQTIDAILR